MYSHEDVPYWVKESRTFEILMKYASIAVVKAKMLHLFLGYPKTKISSMPFMTDWNIQKPF